MNSENANYYPSLQHVTQNVFVAFFATNTRSYEDTGPLFDLLLAVRFVQEHNSVEPVKTS